MSDQKKIVEDIFAQQRKKQQKTQKGKPAGTAQTASAKKGDAEEKKDDAKVASQTQSQQQDFAESSDEETKIELDDKAVIKDAKEVEALKRKENEKENQGFGWGRFEKLGQGNVKTTDAPANTKAAGVGGHEVDGLKSAVAVKGQSNIDFRKGKPMFSKSKNAINQQEFPELGEEIGQKSEPASKKDSTSIGHFGSTIASGTPKPAATEEKKEAKMPVFSRKIKVTTESSQLVENIPQQQTYDYTKMQMSAASAKVAGPRIEGEGERPRGEVAARGSGSGRGRGGYERGSDMATREEKEDSEDSFEEVKDKRKPQFTRGGKDYSGS